MILRIFATDGHTPEHLFRWSVEETARHLCEKQVLWVTKLDGPWRPLVDWFLKQPCCRGVCLDPADNWDWYGEHEVTWRIAQGLYHQEDEKPEAVCWIHDDMAPPECPEFKRYVREWLASDTATMEAPCYQLWDRFDTVRADGVGLYFLDSIHCWMAKWRPGLAWVTPKDSGTPGGTSDCFRPLGAANPAVSPWPFRHAKGLDRDFREQKGFVRRGFPEDRWRNADGVRCVPYDSHATWEQFKATVGV